MRGILVDILFDIYPHYNLYVTRDKKGVKQLLLKFNNELYGTMFASLL